MPRAETIQILREGAPGARRRGVTGCKACGQKMLWCTTVAGKAIPFDVMPEPITVQGDVETVSAEHVHWRTCPKAGEFRRRSVPVARTQQTFDGF
jgi:hypothetical protein